MRGWKYGERVAKQRGYILAVRRSLPLRGRTAVRADVPGITRLLPESQEKG